MLGRILLSAFGSERNNRHENNRGYEFLGAIEKLEDRVLLAVDFFADPVTTPLNRPDVALGTYNSFEEPNLAINNRVDPGNIAISSHNNMLVSNDFFANFNTGIYPAANRGDTWADFDTMGRLFWTNIDAGTGGIGVTQVNPVTASPGANVVVQNPPGTQSDDRQALAVDSFPGSPFRDNIYTIWTRFGIPGPSNGTEVFIGRSNDQGLTWNVVQVGDSNGPDNISGNADDEGFGQQVTISVAPNGDVYGAYHAQRSFTGFEPDGNTGHVIVVRSTDGGATWSKSVAIGQGFADISFNRQEDGANFANTQFLTQGSAQPVVLADPARPGTVYVFAVDDPDNVHGNGDDADLIMARSTNNGATWTTTTIQTGGGSYQLFPTANIDQFGNLIVGWYDTSAGATNAGGNFLLDFLAMYSTDGGQTFSAPFMINDPGNSFDPDEGPLVPFQGGPTTRIGEYFGMDVFGGTGYVVWNGNTPLNAATGQQLFFDAFSIAGNLVITGDDGGFAQDDTITIRRLATNTDFFEVLVNGQRQYAGLLAGLQQINVNGLGGNDTLIVDSSNGLLNLPSGIRYDGGLGFDTLNIQQTGGSQTSETLVVGATHGSGTDTIVGPGGTQLIQYENLEPIITNVIAAALNINGGTIGSLLNAANSINYAASNLFGAAWGMVTIDAFEPIHFVNKTNLNIDAETGNDTLNLNNPNTPTGLTNISINGGDPTSSDSLIVNGRAGLTDILRHSPTNTGTGNVVNDSGGQPAIAFQQIEHLKLVVQEADNDEIRLDGTTGDDRFEFFHGTTADSGIFRGTMDENGATTGPFTLTETTYFGVATTVQDIDVNFFGAGGSDTFVFNGTTGNDNIQVNDEGANNVEIINTVNGDRVAFLEVFNITSALVRGHDGSDVFNHEAAVQVATSYEGGNPGNGSDWLNVNLTNAVTETVTIAPDGTIPSGQNITGLSGGGAVNVSGVETVNFIGGDSADTLIHQSGPQDNVIRVQGGNTRDAVISDSLPRVEFAGLNTFRVDAFAGLDEITFVTGNLKGALPGNYQYLVSFGDSLIIEGSDGGISPEDNFTISNPAGAVDLAITDNQSGVTVSDNGIDLPNHLLIRTFAGDDQVTVDVNGTDLVGSANGLEIEYDGGSGNDSLLVTGTPSVTVSSVTYAPGPGVGEGRLTYASTGNSMTIDFTGLEPVTDLVAAANLNINGTNADNAFAYVADPNNASQGRVTIDGFEYINFANKTALNLNGLGGNDQITINNLNVPTGLTNINVNGGPGATDHLHVIGTPGADTFTLSSNNLVFNTLNVSFTGVDTMLVAGRDGDDTFNVRATSISVVLVGNAGTDTFNVSSSAPNLSGNLNAISNELRIDGGSGANSMNVSDFSSAVANNAYVTLSSITGFAPASILYAATGGTMNLLLSGSNTQPDQFIVQSLLLGDSITINGNGGNDRLVLKPGVLGNANLFGNAGNDVFRVELVGGGNRQVLASGGNGNDNLAVVGSSGNETFQLDAASLTANSEVINFNTMEAMQVFGREGDDTFNVNATNFFVLLDGGTGNDTYNITGAYPGGNLNNINGPLTANGGSGSNALNISNLTGAASNAFVTNAHIFGLAPAPVNYSSTGGTFDIALEGSGNADNFGVVSLKAADTLAVSGNGGDDHFHVSSAALGNLNLSGDAGDDSFVVLLVGSGNRQVTVDGGSGTNPLSILGTSGSDVLHLHNPGVTRGNEDVNHSSINTLYVNTMNGSDVVHINTGAPITRVDGGEGNDHLAVNNTNGISNLTVNGDGGTDLVIVKRTNAPTYVNGGAGNDSINIGSTMAVDFGNLDLIKQVVIVNGGSGSDLLYLNDRAAVGEFEYDVYPHSVSNTATGPARAFAGVNYDSGIDNLRLDGTDDRNVFSVRPSFNTRYFIDGNLPSRNQVDAASQGDFLNLITVPNDGHQLSLTNRDTGTGFWEFTNGLNRVDFTEIEQFNHVERLAIGSDSHSFNQLIVRDPETGNLLFDIQPYEPTFHGAVRVATGDINGDGIPDIITAPGPGRVATVKVFDGWDGSEFMSFNAYPAPMYDGLFVAAGNVTGSAAVDIVTSAGPGTRYSEVRVFRNSNNGETFNNAWSFLPYGAHATAGASIAVGNVNNDAYDDIITAPLHGRVQIAVFAGMAGNQPLTELARYYAFGSDFYGGAYVAAGNYMGDGRADIIVGAGHNSGPGQYSSLVQVFDGASLPYQPLNFIPADFSFKAFGDDRVAVNLAAKDYDLDGRIDQLFAGQGPHGHADVIRVFQPLSGAIVDTVFEDFDGVFLG